MGILMPSETVTLFADDDAFLCLGFRRMVVGVFASYDVCGLYPRSVFRNTSSAASDWHLMMTIGPFFVTCDICRDCDRYGRRFDWAYSEIETFAYYIRHHFSVLEGLLLWDDESAEPDVCRHLLPRAFSSLAALPTLPTLDCLGGHTLAQDGVVETVPLVSPFSSEQHCESPFLE